MIKVNFKKQDGRKIPISINSSSTVRELLMEYLKLQNEAYTLDYASNNLSFIIGDLPLLKERYLDKQINQIREFKPEAFIQVRRTYNVDGGGGGITTVDISKNNTRTISFSSTAPYYREVCDGLNIMSICKNKNNSCDALNDVIYIKIGFVKNWNLCENLEKKVKCPVCDGRVKPLNYGFTNCNYEIEYEKEVDDGYEDGKVNGKAEGNEFKLFNESESGTAVFPKLIFNITHL